MFVSETHDAPWTCCVGATCHGSVAGSSENETGGFVAGCEERNVQTRADRFDEP